MQVNEYYRQDFVTAEITNDTQETVFGMEVVAALMDEEGNQSEYKIVACAEMDGTEYMALEPIIEDPEEALMDAAELVFLKVSEELDEDGEAYLDAILDEDELDRVAEIFRDKLSEEYEFLDEDEEE